MKRMKEYSFRFIILIILLSVFSCSNPMGLIPEQKKNFCDSIHRNDSITLSGELKSIRAKLETSTGAYVLEDGDAAMVARAWLSEYAEKTMDIQYFIFSTDNVGLIACDYIVRAADRGVKVRILIDDILVDAGINEVLTMDSHKNIEIKIYNPGINLGKNIAQKIKKFATDFRNANQRMHNKTFTVDGMVTITGGRNIADEYFDYDHAYNFRDRDVMLLGKTSREVTKTFEEFWQSQLSVPVGELTDKKFTAPANDPFSRLHLYACNPENFWPQVRVKIKQVPNTFKTLNDSGKIIWTNEIMFVSDRPGKNNGSKGLKGGGTTKDTLAAIISRAKKTADIQSPYLVTTPEMRELFTRAVKRGVKVRILTNSLASTDNLEAFNGYQRNRKKLLETGVEIYEMRPDAAKRFKIMTGALQEKLNYQPVFGLHAKTMVIDGHTTVIGTFNIDPRSANLNTECITVIHSEQLSAGVLKEMNEEFKPDNSWQTSLSWNPDAEAGFKKRIKSASRRIVPKDIL